MAKLADPNRYQNWLSKQPIEQVPYLVLKCSDPRKIGHVTVRCRKCPPCLETRRRQWTARICQEWQLAPRIWFATWTYANVKEESYAKVQEAFRTLRRSNNPFRYICTTERESSGVREDHPHYHLLIFGQSGLQRRTLDDCWKAGHSKTVLAKREHIGYVAKYLFKGTERVRASPSFGRNNRCAFTGAITVPKEYIDPDNPF